MQGLAGAELRLLFYGFDVVGSADGVAIANQIRLGQVEEKKIRIPFERV